MNKIMLLVRAMIFVSCVAVQASDDAITIESTKESLRTEIAGLDQKIFRWRLKLVALGDEGYTYFPHAWGHGILIKNKMIGENRFDPPLGEGVDAREYALTIIVESMQKRDQLKSRLRAYPKIPDFLNILSIFE